MSDELRAEIEKNYEASEIKEDSEEAQEVEVPNEEEASGSEGEIAEDGGETEEPEETEAPEEATQEVQKEIESPQVKSKAPASWSPKARETWGKLPAEAQAQVEKREKEVNKVLQDSAVARKFAQQFNQMIEPHKASLIASGATDPLAAVSNLMNTEAQLRAGNAQQKAQVAANIIKQYGVDLNTLDALLSGNVPQRPPESAQLESIIDQRLAPVNQFLEQQKAMQIQQQEIEQNQAVQSVQEFAQTAEFFNDVNNEMALLIDFASNQGQKMSLQEAYDRACALNPEISKIMATRQQQQQILGTQQDIENKKRAASSVTGRRGGGGGKPTNLSMREEIAAAWGESG